MFNTKKNVWPISFSKFSDVLSVFTFAETIVYLWDIYLGVDILSPSSCFVLYLTSDSKKEESLKRLTIFSHTLK